MNATLARALKGLDCGHGDVLIGDHFTLHFIQSWHEVLESHLTEGRFVALCPSGVDFVGDFCLAILLSLL